jgi:hypothetical protein
VPSIAQSHTNSVEPKRRAYKGTKVLFDLPKHRAIHPRMSSRGFR